MVALAERASSSSETGSLFVDRLWKSYCPLTQTPMRVGKAM